MGIAGRLRYEVRLKALPEGGTMAVDEDELVVSGADAVTLLIAAATSFVSYKDVSGDPAARVEAVLGDAAAKPFEALLEAHVREHRRLFRRVEIKLPSRPDVRPADRGAHQGVRRDERSGARRSRLPIRPLSPYLLVTARDQPANLQGIWNDKMSPPWDSKYTTNINTEMNYWPAEVGNLAECAEPSFR